MGNDVVDKTLAELQGLVTTTEPTTDTSAPEG
jgi:hypothetical protein